MRRQPLVSDLLQIRHVDLERMRRRIPRIARHELPVVFVNAEIKGVRWIGVDDLHVGIHHEQFAEPQRAAAEAHVVRRRRIQRGKGMRVAIRARGSAAELLNELVSLDAYGGHPPADGRRGKQAGGSSRRSLPWTVMPLAFRRSSIFWSVRPSALRNPPPRNPNTLMWVG